jgi:hypothetical protein
MLDSTSIIGGKCEVSIGSGKSPSLSQFTFCGLRWGLPCSSREGENLEETSSYFVHHTQSRWLQTFPNRDVRRFREK